MFGYDQVIACLPPSLYTPLSCVEETARQRAQEIRIRRDAPLALSFPEGDRAVCRDGRLVRGNGAGVVVCAREWVESAFFMLCDRSLYTHQQELVQGFITTKDGVRVGVAGTGVTENGRVTGIRDITSLCLRIPRRHDGCAIYLCEELCKAGELHSLLLAGAPATGKTSLLRDAARRCAAQQRRVAVVDERGELSAAGGLAGCDVLKGIPKATAALQAVRCLAPDILILDELGNTAEVAALIQALGSGVCVVASVHAVGLAQLARRPPAVLAMQSGVFEKILLLEGRCRVGHIVATVTAREWEEYRSDKNNGSTFGCNGGGGTGFVYGTGA